MVTSKTEKELKVASSYFVYHLRMYVETLIWLHENDNPNNWDNVRNSIIESHLIHLRVLIQFFKKKPNNHKDTDINYEDFLDESDSSFISSIRVTKQSPLDQISIDIGGRLVHLTSKAIPNLKSQQEWVIKNKYELIHHIVFNFLNKTEMFTQKDKEFCFMKLIELEHIIPFSIYAST